MGIEYTGDEFVFAVEIPLDSGTLLRPFNQTDGGTSTESDTIELKTKDKIGLEYGSSSRTISMDGLLTEGDVAIPYLEAAPVTKTKVKIYDINTRTKEANWGMYVITKFERSFSDGDSANYSLEGKLDGVITPVTLTTVPTGVPAN